MDIGPQNLAWIQPEMNWLWYQWEIWRCNLYQLQEAQPCSMVIQQFIPPIIFAVTQWLINHPKFQKNPLYISGDSYSGIIIPMVVQEIYIQWYVNHDFSIWLRKGE